MLLAGCEVDKMIDIRRAIHAHPEGGFQEFQTQKTIKETLLGFGIEKNNIQTCAKTGLVVDIKGTGPEKISNPSEALKSI